MPRPVGRPELFPIKKLIGLPEDTHKAVQQFQADESHDCGYSEAVRRLLRESLEKLGYLEPPKV